MLEWGYGGEKVKHAGRRIKALEGAMTHAYCASSSFSCTKVNVKLGLRIALCRHLSICFQDTFDHLIIQRFWLTELYSDDVVLPTIQPANFSNSPEKLL